MRRARGGRRLAFLGVSLCIGILGTEAVVRVFSVVGGGIGRELARRDPYSILYMPHGHHGYKQKPNASQEYWNGTTAVWNSLGYRGPEVELDRPPGTYRIVLLGGSTSHGYGVDNDQTIDAHMRRILRDEYPERKFEVVNLALGGYDSYQVFERMRVDGVPLDPDLVIINSGINDVRNSQFRNLKIADPRTLLWEADMSRLRTEAENGGPRLWTRLNHYSYLARTPSLIRDRLRRKPTVQRMRTLSPKPDAIEYFAENLRRTAALVKGVGAGLILSTPPSSLATKYEPSDTSESGYWIIDAETTEAYRLRLADRMRKTGEGLQARGLKTVYVTHDLDVELFLDDCHLTGDGNRVLARNFVKVVGSFLGNAGSQSGP